MLELVPVVARRHPRLTVVVDHLAKPPIRDRGWQPWAGLLAEAASLPNVVTKLSGLNTAASSTWSSAVFSPPAWGPGPGEVSQGRTGVR